MHSKNMRRTMYKDNQDMAKIMAAFESSMDVDDDGYYVHDVEAVDRFEAFYAHRDENFNVVVCDYNASLNEFCSALKSLKQGESAHINQLQGLRQKATDRFVA